MNIRISGIVEESIVDGPGVRFSIFTQGCTHNCLNCHNPQTHNLNGGKLIDVHEIISKINKNPIIDGVTFTGGEPFLQVLPLVEIAKLSKKKGLNIIVYTGFMWEYILQNKEFINLLNFVDYLVDGKFEQDKISLDSKFIGSLNQRIIDVKKSFKYGKMIFVNF